MTTSKIDDRFKPLPRIGNNSCFVCGPGNPSGLHMNFLTDGQCVVSRVVVPDHLCGWRNLVHGGIISAILDEIMGWSALYLLKKVVLTKRITVDFLKPIMVNQALFVEGRVVELPDDRHVLVQGAIHTPDKVLSACGKGLFTLFSTDDALVRELLGRDVIDQFSTFFFMSNPPDTTPLESGE